jgi:Mg-chelatase subunit ChlD
MGWRDCKPSRLAASTKATGAFGRRRAALSCGDRLAVVAFNTHAHVVLPLTGIGHLDRIVKHLSTLKAGGGTDIAEGLRVAHDLLARDARERAMLPRYQRLLVLTDGHGGRPLTWANRLKGAGVLIEVIGFGGDPAAVDEGLLRKVATTDANGCTHYWFFRDTDGLVAHYENLASGIVFRGHNP